MSQATTTAAGVIWNVEFYADTDFAVHLKNLNFWIQAILVKLVPCTGLTILSVLLVHTMKAAEAKRQTLSGGRANSCKSKEMSGGNSRRGSRNSRNQKTNRTTRMLLVVVALFLLTEFPQGVINLLSGVLGNDFIVEVYMMLGDVLDILALINNGINFILYCAMSKQFRDSFIRVVSVYLPFCHLKSKISERPDTPQQTRSTGGL